MERHSSLRGFTLADLLILLTVAAILLGLAVPSFSDLVERQRSWTALNDLRTSLHQAREHAARNAIRVTVCRSQDQSSCMSGDRWSEGWMVFEDPSNLHNCKVSSSGVCEHGGRVLSVSPGVGHGIYITANNNIQNTVRFYPEGYASGSNGTFTACSSDGDILRGMVLAMSGRVRVAAAGDATSC